MRIYLLNSNEDVIHKLDAVDNADALRQARAKCVEDGASYLLAVVARRILVQRTAPVTSLVEDAGP